MRTRTKIVITASSILTVILALSAWGVVVAQSDDQQVSRCGGTYASNIWDDVSSDYQQGPRSIVLLEWVYQIASMPEGGVDNITVDIHRQQEGSSEWTLMVEDYDQTRWETIADPGTWEYRLRVTSITVDGVTEHCADNVGSVSLEVHVPSLEEQAQKFLNELCLPAEVINLRAIIPDTGGPGNTLMLKWNTGLESLDRNAVSLLPDKVHYQVERAAVANIGNNDSWQTLGTTTEQIWSGPADFGHWFYRVGTIRLEGGGATQDCELWWATVEVRILTPEEKAQQERQFTALQSDMVRCGTEHLAENVQGKGRQVVASYVSGRVSEIISEHKQGPDHDEKLDSLISLTVLVCANEAHTTPYGVYFSPTRATLTLLRTGNPWVWYSPSG